jgi:hypothetical protein
MLAAEVNIRSMVNSRQPDPRWMMQLGEAAAAAEQAGDLPAAAYRDMVAATLRDPALLQRLGVPVLALEGDSFRSRNGIGILINAGLDPLVTR